MIENLINNLSVYLHGSVLLAFLAAYLTGAGDVVTETVGGYALEGLGAQLFERITGDYFTVIGLPLIALLGELRRRGIMAT